MPDEAAPRVLSRTIQCGEFAALHDKICEPPEIIESISQKIAQNTWLKLPLWAASFRRNLPTVWQSKDLDSLPKTPNQPALCLGGGPSLWEHLGEINQFKGVKIACERRLPEILAAGVVPDYVLCIDSDPIYRTFIDHPLVDKYADRMTGVFGTCASPELVERWPGKKVFYVPWLDDITKMPSVAAVMHIVSNGKGIFAAGATCGQTVWTLANFLGASPVVLLGIDYAYELVGDLTRTQSWQFVKHLPTEQARAHYFTEVTPFGRKVLLDVIWDAVRRAFLRFIRQFSTLETMVFSEYLKLQETRV